MPRDKIAKIMESIDKLKQDLRTEYINLQSRYDFFIQRWKVIFTDEARNKQRMEKINAWKYAFTITFKHLLSIPFIYVMIVPAVLLDIFLIMYQFTAFPLYGIPRVKRRDYFIYDRRFLAYLNIIQKINCLYCSYVNGLFAYAVEIGWRTEQYWCPIKHAMIAEGEHKYFKEYADYWDPKWFKEIFNQNVCFKK